MLPQPGTLYGKISERCESETELYIVHELFKVFQRLSKPV